MSTLILLFLFIVVPVCVGGLLGWGLAWLLRSDAYEPAAAEAPRADPHDPACPAAPADPVEQHYASVGDTFGFSAASQAFDEVLNTIGPPPGWKPDRLPTIDEEIDHLVSRYRRGEDIESGAPRERP